MNSPLPASLALQRLHPADEVRFGELVRLYEEAFPAAERKPVSVLQHMLAAPGYQFLLALENEMTAGFAIVCLLQGTGVAMLEYMAIEPARRMRGLGRQLVAAIMASLELPKRVLLLEVESDRVPSPDRDTRTRRKRFYRAMGAREVEGLRWLMPTVADAPPPPMEWMIFAAAHGVRREDLRRWISSIYVEVYRQRSDDPRIDEMLAALPPEVRFL